MTTIVTLDQVKTFLNISSTSTDTELPFYMSAAQQLWVNRGGPIGTPASPVDEWYDGGSHEIVLRQAPVSSIATVEESIGPIKYTLQYHEPGTSGYAWGYWFDPATSTVVRLAAGTPIPFTRGARNIHVRYTPGYSSVPEDIQLAVLLLIKHMWETQRGIGKRPGLGGTDDWRPSEGFAWPNRCEQILAGYKVPGIA